MIKKLFIIGLLLIGISCNGNSTPIPPSPPVPIPPPPIVVPPSAPPTYVEKCGKLFIDGKFLRCSNNNDIFRWRGITWFRFLHQVANNEDTSYLTNLSDTGFNLIRVLSTASLLFDLAPSDGLNNLDNALEIAEENGFYVEIVAVIDSGVRTYDWRNHAREVARICSEHVNCVYEFANEPGHGVQSNELHDLENLTQICHQVTGGIDIILSCGSWGGDEPVCIPSIDDCQTEVLPHPIGDYLTTHLDRGRDKWNNVRRMRELERMEAVGNKPVINDEPIGFDELDGSVTGRQRFNDCDIALAFGVLSRIMEVETTFHLQSGLLSQELGPIQEQCSKDFILGTKLFDDNVVFSFKNTGWFDSPIDSADFIDNDDCCVVRVYSGISNNEGATVALGINGDAAILMKNGWSLDELLINRNAIKVWRITR
jgi:hypothetical protein